MPAPYMICIDYDKGSANFPLEGFVTQSGSIVHLRREGDLTPPNIDPHSKKRHYAVHSASLLRNTEGQYYLTGTTLDGQPITTSPLETAILQGGQPAKFSSLPARTVVEIIAIDEPQAARPNHRPAPGASHHGLN